MERPMRRDGAIRSAYFAFSSIAVLLIGMCIMASPVVAQSTSSATIHGTIKDETSGALPGVTVTLSSPALQVGQMVAVSETDGSYRFVDLPAGTYRAKFELTGFATIIR